MEYEYVEHKQNDEELKIFLMQNHLHIQKEYEWGYKVYENKQLVACGFVQNHLLEMFAIDERYRHQGILQNLLQRILETCIEKEIDPVYLFTKKEHISSFLSCGLFLIIQDDICMMSNDLNILRKKEIREKLLSEKWPYSYYFCKDLKEFEVYKTKIKECIRNGN